MATTQHIKPIARGFPYSRQVVVTGEGLPLFPEGCQLRAEVRATPNAAASAGTLTTEDASIVRDDDNSINIYLSGSVTEKLVGSYAHIDFVRTDESPDVWLGVVLQIPVTGPITAPGDDV